jgi:hypothetical protein
MDVFFSVDDREEYLQLLSQSASKYALDFLAGCLMNHHAHFRGHSPDHAGPLGIPQCEGGTESGHRMPTARLKKDGRARIGRDAGFSLYNFRGSKRSAAV